MTCFSLCPENNLKEENVYVIEVVVFLGEVRINGSFILDFVFVILSNIVNFNCQPVSNKLHKQSIQHVITNDEFHKTTR